jgi:hypothetical protein
MFHLFAFSPGDRARSSSRSAPAALAISDALIFRFNRWLASDTDIDQQRAVLFSNPYPISFTSAYVVNASQPAEVMTRLLG